MGLRSVKTARGSGKARGVWRVCVSVVTLILSSYTDSKRLGKCKLYLTHVPKDALCPSFKGDLLAVLVQKPVFAQFHIE